MQYSIIFWSGESNFDLKELEKHFLFSSFEAGNTHSLFDLIYQVIETTRFYGYNEKNFFFILNHTFVC